MGNNPLSSVGNDGHEDPYLEGAYHEVMLTDGEGISVRRPFLSSRKLSRNFAQEINPGLSSEAELLRPIVQTLDPHLFPNPVKVNVARDFQGSGKGKGAVQALIAIPDMAVEMFQVWFELSGAFNFRFTGDEFVFQSRGGRDDFENRSELELVTIRPGEERFVFGILEVLVDIFCRRGRNEMVRVESPV